MHWQRRLAVLFHVLALAGRTSVAAGPGQVPNAPYQQEAPRDTEFNEYCRVVRVTRQMRFGAPSRLPLTHRQHLQKYISKGKVSRRAQGICWISGGNKIPSWREQVVPRRDPRTELRQ
jgi:hypothetical protein